MPKAKAPAAPVDPKRAAQIKAIHAMRREIKLNEDGYRALVGRISGGTTESAGDLDAKGRARLLTALRGLGGGRSRAKAPAPAAALAPAAAPAPGPAAPRSRRYGDVSGGQWPMIRSLWAENARLGVVRDGSAEALEAFVRRQTKQDIGTIPAERLNGVVEALKAMAARGRAKAKAGGAGGTGGRRRGG